MAHPAPVQDLGAGSQSQIYRQLTALQQELEALRGAVERNQHALQLMSQRQQQLEQRLTALTPVAAKNSGAGGVARQIQIGNSDRTAYDGALLVLKKKPVAEAQQQFEQFLKDYPQSTYVSNAHYWLGQVLFSQGKKEDAVYHFAVIVKNFPQSAKRGDSMLKIGLITQGQGDVGKAKDIYKRVVQQYANSPAAERAKAQLAALK